MLPIWIIRLFDLEKMIPETMPAVAIYLIELIVFLVIIGAVHILKDLYTDHLIELSCGAMKVGDVVVLTDTLTDREKGDLLEEKVEKELKNRFVLESI